MARSIRRSAAALALTFGLLGLLAPVGMVCAQAGPSVHDLLDDFIFYVNTANIPMAEATAGALLDSGVTPEQFVGIVEDSARMEERFERAYRRALFMPELEDLSARLMNLYEGGRKERARDPLEIARNIFMLTKAPRQQLLAQAFLREAGEYAVPQLLQVLLARQDQALEVEVQVLLASMGSQVVGPLTAALLEIPDETAQIDLARILEQVSYPAAIPYLAELHATTRSDDVRRITNRALEGLKVRLVGNLPVAQMYRDLGEQFYGEPRSLTSFPGEEHQLLWSFHPDFGLQPTAIRTEVYHEARVMTLVSRALEIDRNDAEAASLWVAANFSRELDQPEGYDNPAYPPVRKDAMYYAVAAGPEIMQQVLARALTDRDTRLARLSIEALSRSAGSTALVGANGRALVDALTYPERRVRYEAALAIARAHPREVFAGADQVVPILAGVIRDASTRYALVIAGEIERQQQIRDVLEGMGYIVLPPVANLGAAFRSISESSGIDVIVTDLTTTRTLQTISDIRATARLRATPVLAMMPAAGVAQHRAQFEPESLSELARTGLSRDQLEASIEYLVHSTTGEPILEAEAQGYAIDALAVLRDLAIGTGAGGFGAFDIGDALVPLEAALGDTDGEVRIRVAEVLGYIGLQRAQIALMDAAMEGFDSEREELVLRVIDSAKRFGNLLEQRHVQWIIETAELGEGSEATTAAALMGALNLPNTEFVPLILGGDV